MNAVVFDVALTAYMIAAAAAVGSLFGRREDLARRVVSSIKPRSNWATICSSTQRNRSPNRC